MMTASLLALASLTLIQLLAPTAPARGRAVASGLGLALAVLVGGATAGWGGTAVASGVHAGAQGPLEALRALGTPGTLGASGCGAVDPAGPAWPLAAALVLLAVASAGWLWRLRQPPRAVAVGGTLLVAAGLSPWLSARVAVAAVLVIGGGLLWVSQRHWRVRTLTGALVLTAGAGLWLTRGVTLLVVAATGCLAVLTLATLIARFLAQQDAVFAVSLDHMMAQYSQEVQTLYANMRGWRHDYHDHLQALKAYLDDQAPERARAYLDTLEDKLDTVDTLVHSGNPVLDAIVNAKLTLAARAQIPTNVKVFVGTQPLIADLDLVVIVGNLLDNALEAIEAQPAGELRRLRVYIAILKQQLYISVTNTRPADQEIDVHFASTKNDKRGLGIRRINKLVAKYDGVINRQYEDAVFVTEIAIPLTRSE